VKGGTVALKVCSLDGHMTSAIQAIDISQ
jgi:hypothetical protein